MKINISKGHKAGLFLAVTGMGILHLVDTPLGIMSAAWLALATYFAYLNKKSSNEPKE